MKLTDDEMNELKKDLLYFVKRLSQKGYNSPEEVRFLPVIVGMLLNIPQSENFIFDFEEQEEQGAEVNESKNLRNFTISGNCETCECACCRCFIRK